ncbi:RraA family protein [Algoriphagus sp.]|uniref:RraA family protein n=1 Tax=Algoriphagus sp. TaxID=1872435 RepID=UPI003F6F98EB
MKKNNSLIALLFTMLIVLGSKNLYAQEETEVSDEVLIELYKGARVNDVVDGMVTVGYMGVGVMQQEIAPLWRDEETFKHRISGIAVTVRYAPTNRPMHPGADLTKPENYGEYRKWRGMWYSQLAGEPFQEFIKPGTIVVMDNQHDHDAGTTGSKNILEWQIKGAVGLVAEGGVRDLDEIIRQKNPVYMNYNQRGRGERIGRNEVIDVQRPVVVGGCLVYPGDVIVADADGVVVVPRRAAVRVGQIAYMELADDMKGRKSHYEKLGMELDETVQIKEEPAAFFERLGLPVDPNKAQ